MKVIRYKNILIIQILVISIFLFSTTYNSSKNTPLYNNLNQPFKIIEKNAITSWLKNGIVICNASGDAMYPKICSDGKGGAVIVWHDTRAGNYDIYAQKIDSEGNVKWSQNGIIICNASNEQVYPEILYDKAGYAIAVWMDNRSGDLDLYAQKINLTSGETYWGVNGDKNGTFITNAFNYQFEGQMCSDGNGGVIIAWNDYRNFPNVDIYAQRIDSGGNLYWGNGTLGDLNGTLICNASGYQWLPQVCSDGIGGAIITWVDDRSSMSNSGIYAQRVDSDGNTYWGNGTLGDKNGTIICNANGDRDNAYICSDNENGAIIAWKDDRNAATSSDIYVQRINSTAYTFWGNGSVGDKNGTAICNSTGIQAYPNICNPKNGYFIVSFTDGRKGIDNMYAQKINLTTAEIYWGNGSVNDKNGTVICNATGGQSTLNIYYDSVGGAIMAWQDNRDYGVTGTDIYAQWIDSNGNIYWGNGSIGDRNGTIICNATNGQSDPRICYVENGSAIVTWCDGRNKGIMGFDIYAQKVILDNEAPIINNITQNPLNPGDLNPVNITVNVTDYWQIDTVLINTNYTGSFDSYAMDLLSGSTKNGIWNYTIPACAANLYINYSIWVNDTFGNFNTTIQYQYLTCDNQNPVIIQVIQDPLLPDQSSPVNITVHASDNAQIDKVKIISNHTGTFQFYIMQFLSGFSNNGYWNYTIPAYPAETLIIYSIWINDTSNNSITDGPYQYLIIDTEAPNIISVVKDPNQPKINNTINITVHITDNIGVHKVLININYTGTFLGYEMTLFSGKDKDGYWNFTIAPLFTSITINYSIWANDTSGNNVSSSTYQFTVTPIGEPKSDNPILILTLLTQPKNGIIEFLLSPLGLGIVIIIGIILVISLVIIIRKRTAKKVERPERGPSSTLPWVDNR